ncbi:unnamed protein product, partial [Ectocarpus sp. 12 AP-2014]
SVCCSRLLAPPCLPRTPHCAYRHGRRPSCRAAPPALEKAAVAAAVPPPAAVPCLRESGAGDARPPSRGAQARPRLPLECSCRERQRGPRLCAVCRALGPRFPCSSVVAAVSMPRW